MNVWGSIFINSGLALGALVSLTSLVLSKETSGWYILLIALLFTVEVFARPLAWLEVAVEVLLSISLYLILDDFNITQIGHFLFGASLIWLSGDLIFWRLIQGKRRYRPITLGAGYVLVAMSTFAIWGELSPGGATIYFSAYALFFALYAFSQKEPRLGYFATTYLALVVVKFCDVLNYEKWMFPLIVLAVLYYAAGYWLRRSPDNKGWENTYIQRTWVGRIDLVWSADPGWLGCVHSSGDHGDIVRGGSVRIA